MDAQENNTATVQLIAAVEIDDWDEAKKILHAGGCDVDARTRDFGHSLLQVAAGHGASDVCQLLLEQRADVNAIDGRRLTPLMSCAMGGDYGKVASMLLDARADASMEAYDDFTVFMWAERLNRNQVIEVLKRAGMTDLESSVVKRPSVFHHSSTSGVSNVLPEAATRVGKKADGAWTLIEAVEYEDWEKTEELLRAGEYDVNARTRDFGYSLLQTAAKYGASDVCKLLLAQRADINAIDGSRTTPLMSCVAGGDHAETVSMLLDARADASMEAYDDSTALKLAERLSRKQVVSVLRPSAPRQLSLLQTSQLQKSDSNCSSWMSAAVFSIWSCCFARSGRGPESATSSSCYTVPECADTKSGK